MRFPVPLFVLLFSATMPLAAQEATLVYRLGKDTAAVEQYTHSNNRIAGTVVQRAGASVSVIRYELTYGRDGRPTAARIARTQADGAPVPNQPTETRFAVSRDSVVRESVRGDSVQRAAYAMRGAMIAFPVYAYGPTELLAAMLRRGQRVDSLPALGAGGGPGFIGLENAGGDTLRLRGSPYPMRLVFDERSRLLAVDGGMTTNKVLTSRDEEAAVDMSALARTIRPTGQLSARDVARAAFGAGGIVLVDYGRPMVRERTVWGGALVPFDSVWRAGANDATHLFTTRVLTFGELVVPAGSYTLWIQHTRHGTFLIINRQTGQWGTQYDASQDVGRVPMEMTPSSFPFEEFTITVRALGGNRGALEFAWGQSVATAPFMATTR